MKPYYEDEYATIYHGDAIDVLADADLVADCVVTDPPYSSGGRNPSQQRNTVSKSNASRSDADWLPSDSMGGDSYLWWMREVAVRCMGVCTPGAHGYVFTDWRQYGNVVTGWETRGWSLRSVVVWDKNRGGAMGGFWRNNHEWVAVFAKGAPRKLPHGGFFNTWREAKPQGGEHPTVKPVDLIQLLVEAGTPPDGTVLDPFMGSGTTLVAAKNLGRKSIGIEIEERYCEIAAERLSQQVLEL